jgi:hypothetical protein
MTLYTWPYRLLTPAKQMTRIAGNVVDGGQALSGFSTTASFSGGGFWRSEVANISLIGEDRILAARAWSAHLDGGSQAFVMPLWDLGFAPRPWAGGERQLGGLPASAAEGDWFGWEASLGEPLIVASLAADALMSAVQVVITLTRGAGLRGGQHFSLNHATWGWRIYRIERIVSRDGDDYTVRIRTPLREDIDASAAVEFDVPRCVMKLDPQTSIEPTINGGRLADPISAAFIETRI